MVKPVKKPVQPKKPPMPMRPEQKAQTKPGSKKGGY